MDEKNTNNIKSNTEQTKNKDGGLGKGIKSFFKKVKDTLEKVDKKLDETMDNDPYSKKDSTDKSEDKSSQKQE